MDAVDPLARLAPTTPSTEAVSLTATERRALEVAACGNCGERTAVLNLVARIKAEAVQAERERLTALRDEIQRRRQLFRGHKAHPQYLLALDDAYGLAANACRDAARGEGR